MCSFECDGWLHITIDDWMMDAAITIQHKDDHIPYFVIGLPEDVKKLISDRCKENVMQVYFPCQYILLICVLMAYDVD